jgi:hypothetical protein
VGVPVGADGCAVRVDEQVQKDGAFNKVRDKCTLGLANGIDHINKRDLPARLRTLHLRAKDTHYVTTMCGDEVRGDHRNLFDVGRIRASQLRQELLKLRRVVAHGVLVHPHERLRVARPSAESHSDG